MANGASATARIARAGATPMQAVASSGLTLPISPTRRAGSASPRRPRRAKTMPGEPVSTANFDVDDAEEHIPDLPTLLRDRGNHATPSTKATIPRADSEVSVERKVKFASTVHMVRIYERPRRRATSRGNDPVARSSSRSPRSASSRSPRSVSSRSPQSPASAGAAGTSSRSPRRSQSPRTTAQSPKTAQAPPLALMTYVPTKGSCGEDFGGFTDAPQPTRQAPSRLAARQPPPRQPLHSTPSGGNSPTNSLSSRTSSAARLASTERRINAVDNLSARLSQEVLGKSSSERGEAQISSRVAARKFFPHGRNTSRPRQSSKGSRQRTASCSRGGEAPGLAGDDPCSVRPFVSF
eukprot:TRINITY_DN23573_c0_g1_i1.p1 TRINITY_DN23573_c0_g1~~TRINITY_DN23573_c0_g1_i1.p1  ORF type:complete len:352 (-),score=40.13 TRINITY_DN23573_c0_g1_i1:532-1587(-)